MAKPSEDTPPRSKVHFTDGTGALLDITRLPDAEALIAEQLRATAQLLHDHGCPFMLVALPVRQHEGNPQQRVHLAHSLVSSARTQEEAFRGLLVAFEHLVEAYLPGIKLVLLPKEVAAEFERLQKEMQDGEKWKQESD